MMNRDPVENILSYFSAPGIILTSGRDINKCFAAWIKTWINFNIILEKRKQLRAKGDLGACRGDYGLSRFQVAYSTNIVLIIRE
jgi:hypothetical protein